MDFGRWRLTLLVVRPGHVAKKSLSMAFSQVDSGVERLAVGMGVVVGIGRSHRPLGARVPVAIIF